MTPKYALPLLACAAALAFGAWFLLFRPTAHRSGGVQTEPPQPAVPSLPTSTGTVVRALPPSAFGGGEAVPHPVPAPAPGDVAHVVDPEGKSLEARLAALARLEGRLSDAEVGALLDFLDRKDGGDALPPEKLNALKNDVANLLRSQSRFPESLAWRLAAMCRDPGHDGVWRDYCIQHAGAAWGRIGDPAAREEIRSVMWGAATNSAVPWSGTALIALRNLALSGNERKEGVASGAIASASAPSAPEGVRVTALQIAAELGAPGTAELARSLLADRGNSVHLRMSAAAALGRAGDASDLPALDALAGSSEPRLRSAGAAAAGRLRAAIPRSGT